MADEEEQAIDILESILMKQKHPLNEAVQKYLPDLYLRIGKTWQVIDYYTNIMKLSDENEMIEEALFHLGMIELDYMKDVAGAKALYLQMQEQFHESAILEEFANCIEEKSGNSGSLGKEASNEEPYKETLSAYELKEAFPNPFNPTTHTQYILPEQSDISIIIYDVVGRQIKNWLMQGQKPGWHEIVWDGTNQFDQRVATGIYIYQMQAGDFIETKKMVFMK